MSFPISIKLILIFLKENMKKKCNQDYVTIQKTTRLKKKRHNTNRTLSDFSLVYCGNFVKNNRRIILLKFARKANPIIELLASKNITIHEFYISKRNKVLYLVIDSAGQGA